MYHLLFIVFTLGKIRATYGKDILGLYGYKYPSLQKKMYGFLFFITTYSMCLM